MDIERSFNNIEDRKTYVQVPPQKEEELLLVPRGEGGKMLCGLECNAGRTRASSSPMLALFITTVLLIWVQVYNYISLYSIRWRHFPSLAHVSLLSPGISILYLYRRKGGWVAEGNVTVAVSVIWKWKQKIEDGTGSDLLRMHAYAMHITCMLAVSLACLCRPGSIFWRRGGGQNIPTK